MPLTQLYFNKIPLHRIISGFFIVLILMTLVNSILFFIHPTEKSKINIPLQIHQENSAFQLVQNIPQWHLFGEAPVSVENLAQTRLELVLNGVMINHGKESTYAIIAENGKDQKLYHIGDNLPGGATLYQIGPHNVVIQYNGKLEQLPLQKPE